MCSVCDHPRRAEIDADLVRIERIRQSKRCPKCGEQYTKVRQITQHMRWGCAEDWSVPVSYGAVARKYGINRETLRNYARRCARRREPEKPVKHERRGVGTPKRLLDRGTPERIAADLAAFRAG